MVTSYNRYRPTGGGYHYEGIGSIYKSSRGIRGFGNLRHQFGRGFGSFIGKIFGKVVPFLRNTIFPTLQPAIHPITKSLLNAASNVVKDTAQGENIVNSVKKNLTDEGKKLLEQAPAAFSGLLRKHSNKNITSEVPSVTRATRNYSGNSQKRNWNSAERANPKKKRRTSKFPGLSRF